MKRQSGKKPSRFNLVVLSSGVQIYRPDCARLKQRTCGEVKSKKTSTEREEGCEDHMSVGVHCVCVCARSSGMGGGDGKTKCGRLLKLTAKSSF